MKELYKHTTKDDNMKSDTSVKKQEEEEDKLFEDASNMVASENQDGDKETKKGTIVDGESKEVQRRTVIHRAGRNVEGEALDFTWKEEAEIVTKISATKTKLVVSTQNKSTTTSKEDSREDVDCKTSVLPLKHLFKGSETRLLFNDVLIEIITSETNDEDEDTIDGTSNETSLITGFLAAEHTLGKEPGVVLQTSNDVPVERVEDNMSEHNVHQRIVKVKSRLDCSPVNELREPLQCFHSSSSL